MSKHRVRVSVERPGIGLILDEERANLRTDTGDDRQSDAMAQPDADKGTSTTAPTATIFTADGKSYAVDRWKGHTVVRGTVYGVILSNTAVALTIDKWYDAANPGGAAAATPAAGDYVITPGAQAAFWIALSTDAGAPAVTDTVLTGEITTGGLARAVATYSHTVGSASYKSSKVFTATASFTGVRKAGEFSASSGGPMWFENTFTAANLEPNDTLTVDWTKNI